MLSDRRQRVLAALIEEYVARALPVGSRTLAEHYRLGVSPATVRNELSVLEEEGYIRQPHTSAGRIPTDSGYRAFVDELIASGSFEEDDATRRAIEDLRRSARELDDLMEQTSSALARLTDCFSIVLSSGVVRSEIKQITLISLDPHSAVAVVVFKNGEVFNRRLEFADSVQPDDLARVQSSINNALAGASSADFDKNANEVRANGSLDSLTAFVLNEIVECVHENTAGHSSRLGMTALMRKPEFSRTESLLPVIQALNDDALLLELFDANSTNDAPIVKIGSENNSDKLAGISIVASRYGQGDAEGVVAVIGPTRMDYSRVLNAVRTASAALDREQ